MCKVFEQCGQDGVGICLASLFDLTTTICVKAFITYIKVTVLAPIGIAVEIFGTDIFTDVSFHKTDTSLVTCTSLFFHLSLLPHSTSFKTWELDSKCECSVMFVFRSVWTLLHRVNVLSQRMT
jgi:hypothetical protein